MGLFFNNYLPDKDQISTIPSTNIINKYIESLKFKTGFVILQGPFVSEQYATHHISQYKSSLISHHYYDCNSIIERKFVFLCKDNSLLLRDNERLNLGINPNNHKIELYIHKEKSKYTYYVISIDNLIPENEEDLIKLNQLVTEFPPLIEELK